MSGLLQTTELRSAYARSWSSLVMQSLALVALLLGASAWNHALSMAFLLLSIVMKSLTVATLRMKIHSNDEFEGI